MKRGVTIKKWVSRMLFVLLLANMVTVWIACRHNFPEGLKVSPHFCTAQIYRGIPGGEFTEEWQSYAWPCDPNGWPENCNALDPGAYCLNKLNHYMTYYMAPGFAWSYRNFTAAPFVGKQQARDCRLSFVGSNQLEVYPPTYGGPFGAELRWIPPLPGEASANLWLLDKDDVTERAAAPSVKLASADFAERTGLRDPDTGLYVPGVRHIRFSDLYLELNTPFPFGPDGLTVTEFHIQSVGTIIAEHQYGDTYVIQPMDAKFFIGGHWQAPGSSGVQELCAMSTAHYQSVTVNQGYLAHFDLSLDLNQSVLAEPMTVHVELSKPPSATTPSFQMTQPFVSLTDRQITGPTTNLQAYLFDNYNDIDPNRLLWFENFEVPGLETFLGKGDYDSQQNVSHLHNVSFSYGDHDISFVAYNKKGAYNTGTMTLTRLRVAQFGAYRNGAWYLDLSDNRAWDGCAADRCEASFGGVSGDKPVVGDWVGSRYDGWTKIGVFRSAFRSELQKPGWWYLDHNANGKWDGCGTTLATDRCYSFGLWTDKPVTGDWNGDGKTEIGVFRAGKWYIDYNGNGAWDGCGTDRCYAFGIPSDIPVAGDWNGDGTTEIGVFRNGTWVLDMNGNGAWNGPVADRLFTFGLATDVPVTGDWNGNGKAKIGVFRNSVWVLDMDGNGMWSKVADDAFTFGLATDKPATGIWW